jgi:hypothetical protein
LINSLDQLNGPSSPAIQQDASLTTVADSTHLSSDGLGPGLWQPQTTLEYGRGGLFLVNAAPGTQTTSTQGYQWATFDGTTNAPQVYPNSSSLQSLVNALFFQVTNSTFPQYSLSGQVALNQPYKAPIGVSGGTPPYTWSLAANSPGGLPPGLVFTNIAGQEFLYGPGPTNASAGTTYDFYVQATDSSSPAKTAMGTCSFLVSP